MGALDRFPGRSDVRRYGIYWWAGSPARQSLLVRPIDQGPGRPGYDLRVKFPSFGHGGGAAIEAAESGVSCSPPVTLQVIQPVNYAVSRMSFDGIPPEAPKCAGLPAPPGKPFVLLGAPDGVGGGARGNVAFSVISILFWKMSRLTLVSFSQRYDNQVAMGSGDATKC